MPADTATKKYRTGLCCSCGCFDGSLIDRWLNVTTVRKTNSCADPTVDESATPFGRFADLTEYKQCGTIGMEEPVPADHLGPWLTAGDLNGAVSQKVASGTSDINACATPDATHFTKDHNCYQKSGTVNMAKRRRGGKWVLAKKYWHGATSVGWVTNPDADFNNAPIQTKYLKYEVRAELVQNLQSYAFGQGFDSGGNLLHEASITQTYTGTIEHHKASSVGRNTGILSALDEGSADTAHYAYELYDSKNDPTNMGSYEEDTPNQIPLNTQILGNPEYWIVTWGYDELTETFYFLGNPGSPILVGTESEIRDQVAALSSAAWIYSVITLTVDRTGIDFVITISPGATNPTCPFTFVDPGIATSTGYTEYSGSATYTFHAGLAEPYTAGDVLEKFNQMMRQWNLSDANLAKLREDEKLALAPLICLDEVQSAISPSLMPSTMDDYSETKNEDGSWPQRTWIDPNDYYWTFPGGETTMPEGFTGGATITTPIRTGEIISHNPAGSGRHFWPGYAVLKRVQYDSGGGAMRWHWENDEYGAFSESPLPETALRWMDNDEAQYDGQAYRGVDGFDNRANRPQAFLHQQGGVLWGGKYVEAVEKWQSVNYCRPCGSDKYSVDQSTVCCVTVQLSGGVVTVKKTGNATSVPQDGDFILLETDGIYEVTGYSDIGGGQFELTLGTKIDDLPSGVSCTPYEMEGMLFSDGEQHLGTLRFSNYTQNSITRASPPGVCGRVACTVVWTDSGAGGTTLTVSSQKFLRKDIAGHIYVDLWNTDMTGKVQVELTRVSDTSFTFTYTDDSIESKVWMTGRDVDYTHNSSTRQKTGVYVNWNFDIRSMSKDEGDQPDWFGSMPGVLSQSIEKFTYTETDCPAFIGIVPFYSDIPNPFGIPNPSGIPTANPVENFGAESKLFPMPADFQFDETFGAHWQGIVETVMPDPFWQAPYKPDCAISVTSPEDWQALNYYEVGDQILDSNGNVQEVSTAGWSGDTEPTWATSADTTNDGSVVWDFVGALDGATDYMTWRQDDGSGQADTVDVREYSSVYRNIYPHPAWVEADTGPKAGQALPDGMTLFYESGAVIEPPYWQNGIPIGDSSGGYASIERPWGFINRACPAGNRFAGFYDSFTAC